MIAEIKPPKTKLELISALNGLQIDKIVVCDSISKAETAELKRDVERMIENNQKSVSVILVREK